MRLLISSAVFYLAEGLAMIIGGWGLLSLANAALNATTVTAGLVGALASGGLIVSALLLLVLANIGHVLALQARAGSPPAPGRPAAGPRAEPRLSADADTNQTT